MRLFVRFWQHHEMLLSPYRVIDLSDSRVQLTGQILARLGADVVAVEPPNGARCRRMGPFVAECRD